MRAAAAAALAIGVCASTPAAAPQSGRASPEFRAIFDDYRRGDADAAAEAFASWDEDKVEADAVLRPSLDDLNALTALALLHTEAGIRGNTFGRFSEDAPNHLNLGDWGLERVFEVHSYTASKIVEGLVKRARADDDAGLLSFGRSWYVVSVSYCLRWGLQCMGGLLSKADHFFKDDPELLLLLGAAAESASRPRGFGNVFGGPFASTLPLTSQTHGEVGPERQTAEWSFRRAIERDPTLVEARLRLGRLLHILDRDAEATTELSLALEQGRAANHLFVTHLSALFLGEIHEEEDRMDEAVRHYRMAIEVYPRAHTAAVALGQALVRTGDVDTGWLAARRMFDGESELNRAPLDPYAIYRSAQHYQSASRIDQMRAMIRQGVSGGARR
jgi:tetratricopeptide (TPR) repeat protein